MGTSGCAENTFHIEPFSSGLCTPICLDLVFLLQTVASFVATLTMDV
jgi:hypothetical protein